MRRSITESVSESGFSVYIRRSTEEGMTTFVGSWRYGRDTRGRAEAWYGHRQRREPITKRILEADVYRQRNRGRQQKRCIVLMRSSTICRRCIYDSRRKKLRIVPNGEGEPVWLTPNQTDSQPEGREILILLLIVGLH